MNYKNWQKHEKYFPELIKYLISKYNESMGWYVSNFPDEYKSYPLKEVRYTDLSSYEFLFEGINPKWRTFVDISNVIYSQTDSCYIATVKVFNINEDTVDKYTYSDVDDKLKFTMQLEYTIKNEEIVDVSIYRSYYESNIYDLYEILNFIDKKPWCALWFTIHYSDYKYFKSEKQMVKEVKAYIKEQNKRHVQKDKIDIENIQYTKKLLEEDWNNDQDQFPDDPVNSKFEIYDNGPNCNPRYEIFQLCDELVKVIQDDSEGEDIRNIYTISMPDEIANKLEKKFNKYEKKLFFIDTYWHYNVCTKEWYKNYVKEQEKFQYELKNDYKVLDI